MEFNDPVLGHLVDKITIAMQEGNREEAAKYMDVIIEQYPEVANILMQSIEFNNLMAENEEMVEEFNQGIQTEELKGNLESSSNQQSLTDEDIIKPGSTLEISEEKIINDMNAMLEIEPTNAQEYIQKGTVLTVTEQFEEALSCFDKALELDENNLSALISKGNTLEIMENYEEASKVYDIVMDTEVNDIYDLMSKGYVFENHERYEDALKTYDKALKKDKNNANILFLKGSCLIHLDKYKKAAEILENAIERYNDNPYETIFEIASAYHNKGIALNKINQVDEALEAYSLALGINSEYFPSYYEIGLIQEKRENYENALKNYNKYLEFDTNNSEVIEAKERVEKLL